MQKFALCTRIYRKWNFRFRILDISHTSRSLIWSLNLIVPWRCFYTVSRLHLLDSGSTYWTISQTCQQQEVKPTSTTTTTTMRTSIRYCTHIGIPYKLWTQVYTMCSSLIVEWCLHERVWAIHEIGARPVVHCVTLEHRQIGWVARRACPHVLRLRTIGRQAITPLCHC